MLAVLSLVAGPVEAARPVVFALDLGLVGLALFDFARTPRPGALSIERRMPRTVGLSNTFERVIAIGAPDPRAAARLDGLQLELSEEFPACFEVSHYDALVFIAGNRHVSTGREENR